MTYEDSVKLEQAYFIYYECHIDTNSTPADEVWSWEFIRDFNREFFGYVLD